MLDVKNITRNEIPVSAVGDLIKFLPDNVTIEVNYRPVEGSIALPKELCGGQFEGLSYTLHKTMYCADKSTLMDILKRDEVSRERGLRDAGPLTLFDSAKWNSDPEEDEGGYNIKLTKSGFEMRYYGNVPNFIEQTIEHLRTNGIPFSNTLVIGDNQ